MSLFTPEDLALRFAQELNKACDEAKIPRKNHGRGIYLATHTGLDPSTISRYLNGYFLPTKEHIDKLCEILHKPHNYFEKLFARVPLTISDVGENPKTSNRIPLIEWEDLVDFKGSEYYVNQQGVKTMHAMVDENQGNCFVLEVKSDTMTRNFSPSFPKGTFIVVDSSKQPKNGSFVVFTVEGSKEGYLKEYVQEAGEEYFRSLNDNYVSIKMSEKIKIVGTVIQSFQEF